MSLLQPIAGRTYYIPGANNLGIVATGDGGAIAIDTGLDKDTGRLIRKALDEARLVLRAIINTHHHADHIAAHLSYLEAQGLARVELEDAGMIWRSTVRRNTFQIRPDRSDSGVFDAFPKTCQV